MIQKRDQQKRKQSHIETAKASEHPVSSQHCFEFAFVCLRWFVRPLHLARPVSRGQNWAAH